MNYQHSIPKESALNAIKQFTTANISGCMLKQGSKTHSVLRNGISQLQNQAAH